MATKPTDLPTWGQLPGNAQMAPVAKPNAGKAASGFRAQERLAAKLLNWLFQTIYGWIAYFNSQFLADGRVKQSTRTLMIPGAAFEAGLSSATYSQSIDGISDTNNAAGATAPIILPLGVRITAVRLRIKDSTTGPSLVACRLNRYTAATDTSTNLATSSNSAGSGANQTLAITGLTETLASGVFYEVVMLNQSGTAATKCHGAEVDYDELV